MNKVVELNKCVIAYHDEGYCVVTFKPDVDISKDDAISMIKTVKLMMPQRGPLLVIHENLNALSFEAQTMFGKSDAVNATAVVATTNMSTKVALFVANLFLSLKSVYPMKVFSSEEAALAWLKPFLKKQEI